MKRTVSITRVLSGFLLLVTSLFVSCKKENIEHNPSANGTVRLAIIGARVEPATAQGNSRITLHGAFLSASDFKANNYGIILYKDSSRNTFNAERIHANNVRTSPGSFDLEFIAPDTSNKYVGLFAYFENGDSLFSGNFVKVKDIITNNYMNTRSFYFEAGGYFYNQNDTLDLGTVNTSVGFAYYLRNFNIVNTVNISSVMFSGAISSTDPNSHTLSPGENYTGNFLFNTGALTPGVYYGYIDIICDDPFLPGLRVVVRVDYNPSAQGIFQFKEGTANIFTYSNIDFTPSSKTFSIANVGTAAFTLNNWSLSTSDYSMPIGHYTGQSLGAGQSIPIQIDRLQPPPLAKCTLTFNTSLGTFQYYLDAGNVTPGYDFIHAGTSYGINSTFDFTSFPTITFEIANPGSSVLQIFDITINSVNFSRTGTYTALVNPLGTPHTFDVTCSATVTENAIMTVSTNIGTYTYNVIYSDGTAPVYELRDISETTLYNDNDLININTAQTLKIKNAGTANLNISNVYCNNPLISITGSTNGSIAPASSISFDISCAELSAQSGVLSIVEELGGGTTFTHTYNIDYAP